VSALALLGRRDEAEEILSRLEDESKRQYVRAEYLAMGYAALGDFELHEFGNIVAGEARRAEAARGVANGLTQAFK